MLENIDKNSTWFIFEKIKFAIFFTDYFVSLKVVLTSITVLYRWTVAA
jgi:hypothetical protein